MHAFVHIAKTAGTTLTSILRRSFGVQHFDDRILNRPMTAQDLRRLRKIVPTITSLAGHGIQPHLDLHEAEPSLRYYTFLRDPIDRAISCFQFVAVTEPKYQTLEFTPRNLKTWFLKHTERDNNCQTRHLSGKPLASAAIEILNDRIGFLGLVSHFDESLVHLRAWMGDVRLNIHYQAMNVSSQRSGTGKAGTTHNYRLRQLREFCGQVKQNSELLDFVQKHNQADLQLFRHAVDVVYPKQKRALQTKVAESQATRVEQNSFGLQRKLQASIRVLHAKFHRNLIIKPLKKWLFETA